jgi:GNAT superfamily N-acetyltransferase
MTSVDSNSDDLVRNSARSETAKYFEAGEDTDEGYESNSGDSKQSSRDSSICPTRRRSNFTLTHTLDTCHKTQHFAKTLNVFALSSNDTEAGQIIGRYVNIPLLMSPAAKSKSKAKTFSKLNFYNSLEELNTCNSDGLALAKSLFCPKGQLLARHKGDKNQYIGPWGNELEKSAVLVVKYLYVEKNFRRQGLARQLLDSLISKIGDRTSKTEKGKVKFVVVFPAVIKEDFAAEMEGKTGTEKVKIEKKHYDNAVACYRALGFRRIGLSKWFGLALDAEHKSRQVAVDDDLDPLEEP